MMFLDMIAAGIVLLRGLFVALNAMCPKTCFSMRLTWILLTVGAAAVLLFGRTPAWPEVLFHFGVAALVCADRRTIFLEGSSCN
jgi:hypothetical protein